MKRQKTAMLTGALLAILVYVSCRKTDHQHEQEQPKLTLLEERFFNTYRTADPTEKVLVDFLKRQNNKLHFVDKTVTQIGFPRWDKTIMKARMNANGRSSVADSATTFYIPFVRDSENKVNASLIVRASSTDTIFDYRCDWQYSQRQNNINNYVDSAEYFAIFFMVLDKAVFGYSRFDITDKSIFKHNGRLPLNVRLHNRQTGNQTGRTALLAPVDFCQDVIISFQDCPYTGHCLGPGGSCDNCEVCISSLSYTYCWTEWIETGGGGGGGSTGGGSTGGGGGGSTGGDGTPPPCPGMPVARMMLPEGCSAGWQPSGGGGGSYVPPQEPCAKAQNAAKKMDTIFMKSKADSVLAAIPNLSTETKEKGFAMVKKLRINPFDVTDTTVAGYHPTSINTGTDSTIAISYSLGTLEFTAATLHTHPPIGYAAHSAKDIYDFLEGRVGEEAHFLGTFVAAANGSQYVLTITDPTQASAFLATKSQNLNGAKWNENSEIGKAFKKAYKYFEDKYDGNANAIHLAYEMAMAAVLNQFGTGFTLNKKDAAGNFKPIVVKTSPDPRKPKRTLYTQECL